MRAAQWVAAGTCEIREVAVPEPGAGEVLVKVGGAGLCHSDVHLLHLGIDPPMPFTLGHETAGWVEALGPGTVGYQPGDPVLVHGPWGCGACEPCAHGFEQHCRNANGVLGSGLFRDGGLAEYLLVPSARHLVPLGDLDPRDAAPLDDAALTPYHAIKASLPLLTPGSSVAVIGAGGLGHMAVQIVRALSPARVIAVDTDPVKLQLAGDVGADAAVAAGPHAAAEVVAAAGGWGVTLVLDCVGADDTLALAVSVARPMSKVVVVGIAGGTLPFTFLGVPSELTLTTTFWGTAAEAREVIELARQGRITLHTERIALDDVPATYERLHAGTFAGGRAVAVPNG
jgi:propanol-preferring alcohol dehydrogenase